MSGVCLYNPQNDQFTPVKHLDALIIEMAEDAKGNIWIATQGKGIFKYSPQKQVWQKYSEAEGLNCATINHLCINRENELWAATAEGLYLFNPLQDTFPITLSRFPTNALTPFWKEKIACGSPPPKGW